MDPDDLQETLASEIRLRRLDDVTVGVGREYALGCRKILSAAV